MIAVAVYHFANIPVKIKSFPSHMAQVALISISTALSQTPAYTERPQIWG